jgi:hypothetical protein
VSHENPETAKIFLNLEDATESSAMSTDTDTEGFEHEQPVAPARPQTMSTSSSSVASGPVLVGLIAILGGGSIFGMRFVSKHAAIAAESFVLDYTPPAIGADFDVRFEATMLNLERSTRPVQVPMAYLQRDPFNFYTGVAIAPIQVAQAENPMDALEREKLRKQLLAEAILIERQGQDRAAMNKALGGYQLQSTLQGSNPVARISGEIVRVGGTLSYEITRGNDDTPDTGTFTVESIGGRAVILLAPDGSRYELSIGMPFSQLEAVVEETPAEDTAPVDTAPVDEFAAAAAAAAAAAGSDDETPADEPSDEGAEAEGSAAAEDGAVEDGAVEDGAIEDGAVESTEGEGAELTFMERLKAASDALKESEDDADEAADETTDEAADETTDEAVDETTDEAVDETADEAADETADEAADETADEAVDETADEAVDETADEAADESADEADNEADDETDDESGR